MNEKEQTKKHCKKKWLIIAAIVAIVAATIAGIGIWAYLTDTESVSNVFTVGKVDITLTEPSFSENNAKNITAKSKIAKDPTVKNVGANDAYVYLKVKVPKVTLKDGDTAKVPLFTYQVNSGWSELTGKAVESDSYIEKVYYYNQNDGVLAVNSETPALFNEVQVANITSDTTYTTDSGETKRLAEATDYSLEQAIDINAYAIQINNLPEGRNTVQKAYNVILGNENDVELLVAQGIKVGDYVNYNPASGNGAGLSYTVDTSKSGSTGEAENFNSSDITKWRVLSVKNGTIELVAEQPTSNNLQLRGSDGYINAETILNGIGAIYGHGNGAVGGISINVDDMDQYFKYDKTTYENSNSSTGKYGGTRTYSDGQFIVGDQIETGEHTMTQTAYWYDVDTYKYTAEENEAANAAYKMLCEDICIAPWHSDTYSPFWLASRCVNVSSDYCYFHVRGVGNGGVGIISLFFSGGSTYGGSLRVLPVVTLESGIRGEKGQDGVWNLDV